jgi:hypothetical protein
MKLKFLVYNVIELTYDCNKKGETKPKGHGHRQFDKLYIVPWENNFWYTRVITVVRGQDWQIINSKNKNRILGKYIFSIFFYMVKKRILNNIPYIWNLPN